MNLGTNSIYFDAYNNYPAYNVAWISKSYDEYDE